MAQLDETALNLPHDYYPAIGEFIFRYAQLENLAQELIWRCLDIDNKQGRTLTVGADVSVLIATLNTIVHSPRATRWVTSSHIRGEVGNILGPVDKYRALRNQLAHGLWGHPKGGDKEAVRMHYMKETGDQRLMPKSKGLAAAEIRMAAAKLKASMARAKRLIAEIERDRPPRGPRPPL